MHKVNSDDKLKRCEFLHKMSFLIDSNAFPGNTWYGVDITKEHIADNFEACVWEPSVIKMNALQAAGEATSMILSVDETIKSPKAGGEAPPMMPGRGMGRPMM